MDEIPARRRYLRGRLDETALPDDPFELLLASLAEAAAAGNREPNAMALATSTRSGAPSVRFVLLKDVADGTIAFFTNYQSRKALELEENPRAAAALWWPELERQVRIEGVVARTTRAETDAYFRTRPRGSQLGAWASPQSREIAGREELLHLTDAVEARFADGELPSPEHWGGYRLVADRVEMWQGRDDRLHDRFLYTRQASGWRRTRLAP